MKTSARNKEVIIAAIFIVLAWLAVPLGAQETVETYLKKGNEMLKVGNFNQAIADFTQAIKLDPKNIKAYNGRGVAYELNGKLDPAIQDFTTAIKINPS